MLGKSHDQRKDIKTQVWWYRLQMGWSQWDRLSFSGKIYAPSNSGRQGHCSLGEYNMTLSCPIDLGLNPVPFTAQLIEYECHLINVSFLSLYTKFPVRPNWQEVVRTKEGEVHKSQHTAGPVALQCFITFHFYPNCAT